MKKNQMIIPRAIESFYPYMSGPANQAYRISKELEKKRITSPVLTSDYKAERRKNLENMDGVKVRRFPIRSKFMKYYYTPDIGQAFDDADIISAHSYRSYQTEQAYKAARRKGKPFVLHNHGSLVGYKSFVKGFKRLPYIVYDIFNKDVALEADAVIVNTKQEFNEAIEFGVDRKHIHIIPVGIDTALYKPKKKTASGKGKKVKRLRLLFVGRISRDRNLEPVIEAVKILLDRGVKVKLTIVGGEEKRTHTQQGDYILELTDLAKDLDVEKNVEFAGPKYGAALREHYRTSDIFVYTSLWENFGQTLLEAAAAGLPLVCTRVGVGIDLVTQGKTGKLVDFHSPWQVAAGVMVFADAKKRANASKILIKKVKKDYNWKKIIENYISLYKSLSS